METQQTCNIFVQFPSGETLAYDLTKESNVNMLKSSVCSTGVNFKDLALIFNGKKLEGACNIVDAGLVNNSTVQAVVGVQGGAQSFMDPQIIELARKYRIDKQVCRSCYCNLSVKAVKCRKRRCGHYPDIRKRKALADK